VVPYIDGQNGNKSIYGFFSRVLIRVQERGSLCRKAFNLGDTTPLPMVRTLKLSRALVSYPAANPNLAQPGAIRGTRVRVARMGTRQTLKSRKEPRNRLVSVLACDMYNTKNSNIYDKRKNECFSGRRNIDGQNGKKSKHVFFLSPARKTVTLGQNLQPGSYKPTA